MVRRRPELQLVWLLDYFRSHPAVVLRLKLRLVHNDMIWIDPLGKWRPPFIDVTERELTTASAAWQAYRAATPEACFDLLGRDLSALPLLKPALADLLKELPANSTGLGATEMRMLELISRGYSLTNALFYLRDLRQTRIFNEFEHGYLLDGLAHGPMPAVAGLDDALRTITRETWELVSPPTDVASCRSPNSARRSSPTRKTSAVTTRSIAGGAVPG